jgi:ferritin-like metal-binding protein YciE
LASTLGYSQAAELLDATLQEEKKADELLTQIAEGSINQSAKDEKK